MSRHLTPPEERFIKFVKETTNCWEWTGARNKINNYGVFGNAEGKTVSTHRWFWEYTMGPIPQGKILCHTCDNPFCVRPAHLYVGTVQTNILDKIQRGRLGRCGGAGVTKLKKEDIRDVLIRYTKGESVKQIAILYNVHYNTIYKYIRENKGE